jgi:hypothetical protein
MNMIADSITINNITVNNIGYYKPFSGFPIK